MPAMTHSAAQAAVSEQPTNDNDQALEAAFFGKDDLDDLGGLDDLGDDMTPPGGPEVDAANDALGDFSAIERSLNGEEEEADADDSHEEETTEEEEAGTEDGDGSEEHGEEDEEDGDDAEDVAESDDDEMVVTRGALKDIITKYNAALEAAGQAPGAREEAQAAAEQETVASPEQQAQEQAAAFSAAIAPTELTEEQATSFGIQDRDGFNEYFGKVQQSIGAQAMAAIAGQMPAMIMNQASQALPSLMAAQQFIDSNPEWEKHTAIVQAALAESKNALPNASPRQLVADMETRINIAHTKGEAIAGHRKGAPKKHDARKNTKAKKGQFKGNARNTGGKKGNRVADTDSVMQGMTEVSSAETDEDFSML